MRVMFVAIYKSSMGKKTLVIGASENTERYAAQAIRMLKDYDHEVVALGRKAGIIHEVSIQTLAHTFENVDTVSLYINPKIQIAYYEYVIALNPERVIFNPGTENAKFAQILKEKNIQSENACTLVLLRTDQY